MYTPTNPPSTPGNGPRVLLIDDSATIRTSMSRELANYGCEVLACEDGFEALSKVCEFGPAVIFTDISMPKVDGYEMVTLLRTNQRFWDTPVIMLSSKSGVFDIAKGKLIGCDDYLTKPISGKSVEAVLERYLPGLVKLAPEQ